MKKSLLIVIAAFLFFPLFAQYEVSGGSGRPFSAGKTGLTEIYLLNGLGGAQIKFTSTESGTHQWYRYKQSIDDAEPVPSVQSGNSSVITDIQEGYGYYVAAPIGTGYVWIIDYSRYITHFSDLRVVEDEYRCEQLKLVVNANVTPIYYYVNGIRNTLQRQFLLTFNTLEWQENDKAFTPKQSVLSLNENQVFPEITLDSVPLTNTTFTLTDVFANNFGIAQAITSDEYRAIGIEAHLLWEKDKDREFGDNEKHSVDGITKLGGSAPIGYTFTAYANEPVAAYYLLEVLKQDSVSKQYNTIVYYTDRVLQYTFKNRGNYRVRLKVNDAQSVCTGLDSVDVVIDETYVFIPNAFSPGSSIGVNDEFKIIFRSVTSFRASIYNRWGNLLYQWTDPAKGWNGMVNGRFVPTGAYFVVVEWTDSEGGKHKDSRDVNILRAKN